MKKIVVLLLSLIRCLAALAQSTNTTATVATNKPFALTARYMPYNLISTNYPILYVIEEEFRLKNGDQFYYQHSQLTAAVKINPYLQPFIGYRAEFANPPKYLDQSNSRWYFNSKFLLGDTSTLVNSEKWGLLNARTMLDFTIQGAGGYNSRFRERLRYNTPWMITRFNINPFVYDEVFVDIMHGGGFNQNRVGGGIDVPLSKNIIGTVYYFLATTKQSTGGWMNSNILALQARINF